MKFKRQRHSTSYILLIISTIIMTCASKTGKTGGPSTFGKLKDKISYAFLSMDQKIFTAWSTNPYAKRLMEGIKSTPIVIEDDYGRLVNLLSNDADLIKIGAFKQINKKFNNAKTDDEKKMYILANLQATIELVKSYGVSWNSPMVVYTFAQGLYYAHSCKKLHKDNPGECLKKQMQLYSAFILCHKIDVNRLTRSYLRKTAKEAALYVSKDDKTLQFIDIKISCEIKLALENKNLMLRKAMKMFMGSFKDYDCVEDLLPFEAHINEIDSYPGEYHYLLARAYGKAGKNAFALEHLRKARQAPVVDAKTRDTNKKVQAYYEKIYTRINAKVKK